MAFRFLPADDIFISYPRQGASTYASELARALEQRGFSPFVDKLDARPSPDLTEELKAKIRECKMLVIIGTRRAGSRSTIEDEIKEYLKTGRHAIVAIDFNNSVEKARWYPLIKGISLEPEPRVMALKDGQPSDSVLRRIESQFKYKRSKESQRRTTISLAALSVLFTIVSLAAAAYAAIQVAAAKQAKSDAVRFQGEADTARGERDTAVTEKETAVGERDQAKTDRDHAKTEADTQTDRANKASERAQDAEQARVVAQNEADKQNSIAKSRHLASKAMTYLDSQLDLSLLLGAEAADASDKFAADSADTLETRRSLFSALNHSPFYTTFLVRDYNSAITGTSYSLDGNRMAAGTEDGTIWVWDAKTRQPVGNPLKHPDSNPLRPSL